MKCITLPAVLLAILPAISQAQTDTSPPFNPDPSFTSDLTEIPIPGPTSPVVTFPDTTISLPPESDLPISITLINPTPDTSSFSIDPNDPILTGTPSPRPSLGTEEVTGTGSTPTPTTSGAGGSMTTSTTTRSGSSTSSTLSTSQQAAGAGKVAGGLEGWVGGLFVGILGGVAAVL